MGPILKSMCSFCDLQQLQLQSTVHSSQICLNVLMVLLGRDCTQLFFTTQAVGKIKRDQPSATNGLLGFRLQLYVPYGALILSNTHCAGPNPSFNNTCLIAKRILCTTFFKHQISSQANNCIYEYFLLDLKASMYKEGPTLNMVINHTKHYPHYPNIIDMQSRTRLHIICCPVGEVQGNDNTTSGPSLSKDKKPKGSPSSLAVATPFSTDICHVSFATHPQNVKSLVCSTYFVVAVLPAFCRGIQ